MSLMLIDLELKGIALENGHLCPDLAIGWRVGLFARKFLAQDDGGSIEAGCMSCALEALQAMGSWDLSVDAVQGRHVYLLRTGKGEEVELKVADEFVVPDPRVLELEKKITMNMAATNEMLFYKDKLDEQIYRILSAREEDLFQMEGVKGTDLSDLSLMPKGYLH